MANINRYSDDLTICGAEDSESFSKSIRSKRERITERKSRIAEKPLSEYPHN